MQLLLNYDADDLMINDDSYEILPKVTPDQEDLMTEDEKEEDDGDNDNGDEKQHVKNQSLSYRITSFFLSRSSPSLTLTHVLEKKEKEKEKKIEKVLHFYQT